MKSKQCDVSCQISIPLSQELLTWQQAIMAKLFLLFQLKYVQSSTNGIHRKQRGARISQELQRKGQTDSDWQRKRKGMRHSIQKWTDLMNLMNAAVQQVHSSIHIRQLILFSQTFLRGTKWVRASSPALQQTQGDVMWYNIRSHSTVFLSPVIFVLIRFLNLITAHSWDIGHESWLSLRKSRTKIVMENASVNSHVWEFLQAAKWWFGFLTSFFLPFNFFFLQQANWHWLKTKRNALQNLELMCWRWTKCLNAPVRHQVVDSEQSTHTAARLEKEKKKVIRHTWDVIPYTS